MRPPPADLGSVDLLAAAEALALATTAVLSILAARAYRVLVRRELERSPAP